MGIFQQISNTFWSTSVWLPPNITWADIAPGSRHDVDHADYRDLWYPLPMALVLLIFRFMVERFVYKQLFREKMVHAIVKARKSV